jgi:hypothetical protein
MKATSLLAMTAALSLLVGTSAAFAFPNGHSGPDVEVNVDALTDWDKYDMDGDLGNNATQTISEGTIIQNGQINKPQPTDASIELDNVDHINRVINIADTAQNAANIGDISSTGTMKDAKRFGHGNSISVSAAVGASSSVSASISSISTSSTTHKHR